MLAARWLAEASSDPRWRALYDAEVHALFARWLPARRAGCSLWRQDLYGEIVDQLGGAGSGPQAAETS